MTSHAELGTSMHTHSARPDNKREREINGGLLPKKVIALQASYRLPTIPMRRERTTSKLLQAQVS